MAIELMNGVESANQKAARTPARNARAPVDETEASADKRAEKRPPRVPMHERNITTVSNKDPNKEYRWCLDKDDKLQHYLNAGYEFETDDNLGVGEVTVNPRTQTGHVICLHSGDRQLYLMSIAKELYDADQAAKEAARDYNEEEALRELNSGKDGTYGRVGEEPFTRM